MEDTLRANKTVCEEWTKRRLNPCFNGRYSQSKKKFGSKIQKPVLILVLMEDTLRVFQLQVTSAKTQVLILVLMEDTLRERLSFVKWTK